MKFLLIVTLFSFLFLANGIYAVDFDSSINAINGGLTSALFNFSITNNDAANNITKLNITLNSGFIYRGGARQNLMTFYLMESGTVLSWENSSYIVNNSATVYIWFYASTPSLTGQQKINVSTIDNTGSFLSKNVTLELIDSNAPKWSSNTTTYSVPTSYLLNKNNTFNITWTDNLGLEDVKFEFNGVNYTNTSSIPVKTSGSGAYGITLTDLNANSYNYKWFAEDWNNTENATSVLLYNVSKAMNPITVYFDGSANTDKVVNLGETLNITVTGKGNVYLYENGTLIGSGGSPLTYLRSLSSRGIYVYQINGTSTANYTTNSTGSTYTIRVDYPSPRYSVSTSIPTTWSLNSYALFNVTWNDPNDSNGFSVALIQLNHSGSATNYTMTRMGSTNTSTYELNLTTPMTLTWRIYANNSYNTWNSTELNTSVISRISPTLSISVIPDWNVIKGTRTTVKCSSDQVSVNLYRDGVLVSNPDVQTLSTGEYFYLCNNTLTVNYSSTYESKLLTAYNFMAVISFLNVDPIVTIVQNSSNSTTVVIKNTGNATQSVNFEIENITSTIYSINDSTVDISYGNKAAFSMNFTVSDSMELGDYKGNYKVTTSNSTYTYSFILRITPKAEDYETIENSIALYKANMNKLWSELNQTKAQYPELNYTSIETWILDTKAKIDSAENYVNQNNYYAAYELLGTIESNIASAESELNALKLNSGIFPSWIRNLLIGIGTVVVMILAYLLWPVKGYDIKSGNYRHKTTKETGIEKLMDVKVKMKGKLPIEKMKGIKTKITEKLPKPKYADEIHISDIKPDANEYWKKQSVQKKPKTNSFIEKIQNFFKHREKTNSNEYFEIPLDEGEESVET